MERVSPQVNFSALEEQVVQFWRQHRTFERSLEQTKSGERFMFYDGPPFATGLPHYGHLLTSTIKDIIPRYETMRGRYVERRFGWDTHGVPIEMQVESKLQLKGAADVRNLGVAEFNEACRASVLGFEPEWRRIIERLGRWVDFDNDYKTMDVEFMESVWWVFKQLWDAGRVYEGKRVMPYSWRLSTPLSNFEASSNYKVVQDPSITVRFALKELPGVSLLAWTTTPWTLISNLALCVHPEYRYLQLRTKDGERLILEETSAARYFKSADQYEVERTVLGSELNGLHYEPLFPYFNHLAEQGAFRVVADTYVTTTDGTGVVQMAPAYGEDDYRVCQREGIPLVDPIDEQGNFTDLVPDFAGLNFKDAEKPIIAALKDKQQLYKQDTISHSYPFCYRSETPLMYRAIAAWYVRVEDLRDEMLANNATIHWVPEYVKEGRFGNWLAQARDWNISRNRFWGNPIPLWRCQQCDHIECIGSRAELEERTGQKVEDLHSHHVDPLTWRCQKCGGTAKRIPEVLDCWFESGSMPYAQLHYPFEHQDEFARGFPADFIGEGMDQTRGWFYTLMVIGTALFKKAPFKNVIVNGTILAEDGKKMSKRLQNYPDPQRIFDEYGADALRLYLVTSPAVRGDNLKLSEAGIRDTVRQVMLPLWNVYSFFTTYADIDGFRPDEDLTGSTNPLDRWIISRFQTLVSRVTREMAQYRLYAVVPGLLEFIDELTNWYLRRSRRRFWSDDGADKQHGYNTLYYILTNLSQALAPFLPFVTEVMFRNLATLHAGMPESVHLASYPSAREELIDQALESDMNLVAQVVTIGRSLRAAENLKVRQPLRSVTVVTRHESDAAVLSRFADHIKEELNVKEVHFSADEERYVEIVVKPNLPVLGPKLGKELGKVIKALQSLSRDDALRLEDGETLAIAGHALDASQLLIERKPRGEEKIGTTRRAAVFFDANLTEDLVKEGLAREFVNRIQKLRKDSGFEISDRVHVRFDAEGVLAEAIREHQRYIQDEVLALTLEQGRSVEGSWCTVQDTIESFALTAYITRAQASV